ncbi:MAG: HAD-IIA family hydrolase [Treponemataceae bacterium]
MKLDDFDVVLFDLDGTVYYGSKLIDGANETIKFFRDAGKRIYFATNNSTKTRQQIFEKLLKIGVDCKCDEVLTSGYLAALYAQQENLQDMYIFGSENLRTEFEQMGVAYNQTETAENLLIGYNPAMTYENLTDALQVALHAKQIIACNRERIFPGENGRLMPGCGAMTAPIEWCAKRECDVIIGKPSTLMIELISKLEKTPSYRFLMIGDTYESDIAMAKLAGAKHILISKQPEYHDTEVVASIGEIITRFSL